MDNQIKLFVSGCFLKAEDYQPINRCVTIQFEKQTTSWLTIYNNFLSAWVARVRRVFVTPILLRLQTDELRLTPRLVIIIPCIVRPRPRLVIIILFIVRPRPQFL